MPGSRQIVLSLVLHAVLVGVWAAVHFTARPSERGFYCDDESILKPYKPNTMTPTQLYIFGLITPLLLIALTEFYIRYLNGKSEERSLKAVLSAVCAVYFLYSFSAWAINLLTDVIKFPIGRLRPNFLDVCQPAWGDLECATEDGRPIYVTEYACQGNLDLFGSRERADYEVEEARMSFPSGHAAHSFQAVTFMILYLQARLLSRSRPSMSRSVAVFLAQTAALCSALLVSASRITDNKHHPTDVIAGAALGVAVQTFNVFCVMRLFGGDVDGSVKSAVLDPERRPLNPGRYREISTA